MAFLTAIAALIVAHLGTTDIGTACKAESPLEIDDAIRSVGETFCVDCHGPDAPQGGFRFDEGLSDNLSLETERRWTRALDRVVAQQMPPPDAPQPSDSQRLAFQQELEQALSKASHARQQREGRIALRRLNRRQYQFTLQDLLGSQIDVMDLLPDDNIAGGFDNVGDVLDISAVHLLRYQEAAEKAIRSVIPRSKPSPRNVLLTGREIVETNSAMQGQLGRSMRLDGETLIMHARNSGSGQCESARVSEPGRYRVRAMLTSIGTEGKPLPILVTHSGHFTAEDPEDRRVFDIPADRTVIIRQEFDLELRETVVFNGWDLPNSRQLATSVSPTPLDQYSGPGVMVDWVEIVGPIEPFPSEGYGRLFGESPLVRRVSWDAKSLEPMTATPKEDADHLIRSLLPIVFRRPVDEKLANYFVGIAHRKLDSGESFREAMVAAYTAVFCSPHFLFLIEPPPDATAVDDRLDDYAIAARLSYFLWSSLPDEELLDLAADGVLSRPEVLDGQVERMLEDPKSSRFVRAFTDQWLDLKEIDATSPNPSVYLEFDDFLFWSMPRETRSFFVEVLSKDLSVTEFVHSDWTYLNQRLAQHYGIPGIAGGELRRVSLPEGSHRGGVITQAAVMKVTADGSRTSPVLRGSWILDRIIGRPPDPPPPNTPAIDPDTRGAITIRQQLDKHRSNASCNTCHQHIDPHGFALESFDAIGGWRDFYRGSSKTRVPLENYPSLVVSRGSDVELGGQMADGRTFGNVDDYKQILLTEEEQIARNMLTKLVVYATGAELQFADRQVVEEMVNELKEKDYGLRSMIHTIVQSRLFLRK